MPYTGPYMSDADFKRAMHSAGLTRGGGLRKPKGQRKRYAGAGRAPTAKSVQAIRKVAGEKKGLDTEIQSASVVATTNTNSNSFICNLVRAGAGSFNRVGRKIFCKSLRIHGSATWHYAVATTTSAMNENILRMVVIWDKQPNDAATTWDAIIKNTEQASTETSTVMGLPSYDNMSRFQILRDVKIQARIEATPATGGSTNFVTKSYFIDEYIKLGNRQTVYSADSSPMTIADISTGALQIYFRAQVDSADFNQWTLDDGRLWARLRYSD